MGEKSDTIVTASIIIAAYLIFMGIFYLLDEILPKNYNLEKGVFLLALGLLAASIANLYETSKNIIPLAK